MPERLEPNGIDTITVALSDLPEDISANLRDMFSLTFEQDEYLLLEAEGLLQKGAQEAADRLVSLVDEKLQHGELTWVLPLRLNLVFYTTLDASASERAGQIREIAGKLGGKLGILNSYVCVVKHSMRGEENALAMGRCIDVCKADAGRLQIPILLVNRGLGITIDLPLKATVRYFHVISRNSRLKGQLLARTELVTSIAMLEYDDEDSSSLQEQIDRLQNELEGKGSSRTQMIESVQALMNESSERLGRKEFIQFSQWPLRSDAIGNLFSIVFGRAKLRRALNDVAETFAAVYQKNIHEHYCDGCFQADQSQKTLYELFEAYPAAYVRGQLKSDLDEFGRKYAHPYDAYVPKFHICLGEKKLREQLAGEYRKSLERSRAYIQNVVVREMRNQIDFYLTSGRVEQREKELKDRILRLKAKARAVGNAQSTVDFLQTQLAFLPTQGGVPFENRMNCDMILLISRRIDEDWNQYASYLPNTPQFDVYNYGVLEDQELQALQIMRFNAELYQTNRRLIFQIG